MSCFLSHIIYLILYVSFFHCIQAITFSSKNYEKLFIFTFVDIITISKVTKILLFWDDPFDFRISKDFMNCNSYAGRITEVFVCLFVNSNVFSCRQIINKADPCLLVMDVGRYSSLQLYETAI